MTWRMHWFIVKGQSNHIKVLCEDRAFTNFLEVEPTLYVSNRSHCSTPNKPLSSPSPKPVLLRVEAMKTRMASCESAAKRAAENRAEAEKQCKKLKRSWAQKRPGNDAWCLECVVKCCLYFGLIYLRAIWLSMVGFALDGMIEFWQGAPSGNCSNSSNSSPVLALRRTWRDDFKVRRNGWPGLSASWPNWPRP